jgi:hypothetical protein
MKVLNCPCGEQLSATDDDGIVEAAQRHLRATHPDRADEYEREQILFMAIDLPDPPADGA